MSEKKDALDELQEYLEDSEQVVAVVFGDYGWEGHGEEDLKSPIPRDKRGVLLSWEEAKPYLKGWSFYGGYGAPECYAVYVWTTQRVIFVVTYDGATWLESVPRHPQNIVPEMFGV